jgi:hypothetical protein
VCFMIASYAGVGKTQSQLRAVCGDPAGDPVPPLTHLFEFSDAGVAQLVHGPAGGGEQLGSARRYPRRPEERTVVCGWR